MDESGIARVDPARITRGRELRVVTKTDLSQRVGVSIGVVATWERTGVLRASHFRALCEALNLPAAFFQIGQHTPTLARPNFRLLRNDTAQKWMLQAEAYAFTLGDFVQVLDASVGLPEVNLLDLPVRPSAVNLEVIHAARALRASLGFGLAPIPNATRRVEQAGVAIAFTPKNYSRGVDAYSTWSGHRPLIIQATSDPARLRFDLFHELGHLVMHRAPLDASDDFDRVRQHRARELQANLFAAESLLPSTEEVKSELEEAFVGRYWTKPLVMKPRWGASLQSMLRRALELDLITQDVYDSRWEDIRKRGWRRAEPGRLAFAEMPSIVSRAYRELKAANPDADERLLKFHGITGEFLAQFNARSPSMRNEAPGTASGASA